MSAGPKGSVIEAVPFGGGICFRVEVFRFRCSKFIVVVEEDEDEAAAASPP